MNNAPSANPIWNVMLALTVLAGGAACFIALKRTDFFPSVYGKHDAHNSSALESKHDVAEQSDSADTTVVKEQADKKNPLAVHPTQFVLVAGSFVSNERANHFRQGLAQQFPKSEVVPFMRNSKQFYHVLIGRAENKAAILDMKKKIAGLGLNDCWFYEMKDSL